MSILNFSKLCSKALVLLALAVQTNLSIASAAGNEHFTAVRAHAEEASKHGDLGHADLLVTHASEALTHAEALKKNAKDNHYDGLVSELENAVEHGKKGYADIATKHVKAAIGHLDDLDGHHEMSHESGHHAGEKQVKPHKH